MLVKKDGEVASPLRYAMLMRLTLVGTFALSYYDVFSYTCMYYFFSSVTFIYILLFYNTLCLFRFSYLDLNIDFIYIYKLKIPSSFMGYLM